MRAQLLAATLAALASNAWAYEGIVEKRVFELGPYTTANGAEIADVRVGWEAYGELNEARDNAILITHFFSGTSHAAGRYAEDGARGYWDDLICAGCPLDTERFYVLSSDTLVNLNTGDPNVTTTGPASIDPATGAPYGMDFPVVTIADFVNVQRALVESLGIERLHAVMGASMGALQALEWGSSHPEMVERVIPVIGSGEADAYLIGWLDAWAAPIRLDPNWRGGDYYGATPPTDGLAQALKLVTLHANHWEWADSAFGRSWAVDGEDPAASMANRFAIEDALDQVARDRAAIADANHFLYLVKANQLFRAGHGDTLAAGLAAIEAPTLLVHTPEDLIFFPEQVRETATLIGADGTSAQILELQGTRGHLDGVIGLGQVEAELRAFLAE
jgi:homoserine O-acetyltransferase